MKTRNDFVSNSSSCSFVVAIGPNYILDDFAKDVCERCLKHADEDEKAFTTSQAKLNSISLNYHLRMSELLYLGGLIVGKHQTIVDKNDSYFKRIKNDIANNYISEDEKIVENTDERVVLECNDIIYGMAIDSHRIDYVSCAYHWNNEYSCKLEDQKKAASLIAKFAKNYSDNVSDYNCRKDYATYFISRKTIWNTRALIAAGYKVELKEWMDLDKLDKMLQDGNRLFNIRINNGGDGIQEDALYTFGGWDGEDVFEDLHDVEIIDSETL